MSAHATKYVRGCGCVHVVRERGRTLALTATAPCSRCAPADVAQLDRTVTAALAAAPVVRLRQPAQAVAAVAP